MTRPFRFGVVAPVQAELPAWRDRVRRIAGSGYSTLLMPDVPQDDPSAATEEIQRRREEIGFSYFIFGAGSADALAPVVAKLAGR